MALPLDIAEKIQNDQRLSVLKAMTTPRVASVKELDTITAMVAELFETPVALISMVDADVQWLQSCIGIAAEETPVEYSFCAHAIASETPRPFIILDTHKDERFKENPLVKKAPFIRFYVGFPIVIDGEKIGSLCAIDTTPRERLDDKDLRRLEEFAELTSSIITLQSYRTKSETHAFLHQREVKRHQLTFRASKLSSWVWDLKTNLVESDPGIRKFFDIQHSDPLSAQEIIDQIHSEDRQSVADQLQYAIENEGAEYHADFRIASTGRWLIGRGAVLERDADGNPLSIGGVNGDITDFKNSEEKTKLLLRELNHRVKNTLAMLQSIANQTIKNAKSPEEFKRTFSGRLRGIAAAHTLLSDKEWEPIEVSRLVREQVNVYVDDLDNQVRITGGDPTIGPEESVALGMVLHELATNAVKYGALSEPDGWVDIKINTSTGDRGRRLEIGWTEKNGPTVQEPDTTGFGTIMIKRSLDKVIGSKVELDYHPDGVRASILIPLEDA